MKVVYLNVIEGDVMQMDIMDDLQVFYDMIHCRTVEMPEVRIGNRDTYFNIICDEEALLKSGAIPSVFTESEAMLYGNIIICKANYNTGELESLTDDECAYIKSHVLPVKRVNRETHEARTYFALVYCSY